MNASAPPFEPHTIRLSGTIVLNGHIESVFPLFSPLGERVWVPGWDPQILAPRGAEWEQGMVFRTAAEGHDAIWVVAELDRGAHRVVYYRTEPERLVARVELTCRPRGHHETQATVVYSYVGLSDAGNAEIAEWTDSRYASKMAQWEETINDRLAAAG